MPFKPFEAFKRRKDKDVGVPKANFEASDGKANDHKQESNLQSMVPSAKPVQGTPGYGLLKMVEGIEPVVDIIAVHGLDGKREKSWTAKNGVNWLRDLLPSDIPHARIYSWGYEAKTHSATAIKSQTLYDHARNLVSDLCRERGLTETRRRPIIFVAHSLGGIIVKSALIHSDAARQGALEDHHSIKLSTYGILFMGTPHQGSDGVDLQVLALRAARAIMSTDTGISKHLTRDSGWLRQQHGQYEPISSEFATLFAYETVPTVGKMVIVPQASAVLPGLSNAEAFAIPADHVDMVKFSSGKDEAYQKVSGHLNLFARAAPGSISARWEKHENSIEAHHATEEDFSLPFSLSGVPQAQNFVGREEELAVIRTVFQGDGSQRKVALLQGLGGIGKTQLAVAFIKEQADNYSAIIWLDAKTEDTLKQSFAVAAKRLYNVHPTSALLKRALESKDSNDTVGIIKQWFSLKRNHEWLLVYDNMDNPKLPDVEDPQSYDIDLYFPDAHQGFILITTRSSRLELGSIVSVPKLDIQDSIEILSSASGRGNLFEDPYAKDLAKELDGLPLALTTAGAYLRQASTRLEVYLRDYRTSWRRLQEKSPKLLSYRDRTLYTTWDISLRHIESQSESAGKLLRLWGYFDNQDVWYELLAAGSEGSAEWFSSTMSDEMSFNEVIRILSDHGLVQSSKGSNGYGMHTCVHDWVMHKLNADKDPSLAEIVLRCVGCTVPAQDDPRYWETDKRLLPHAQKCLEYVCDSIYAKMLDSNIYFDALYNLGCLYARQTKLKEAETLYQRALEGYEKTLGPEHHSTLTTVNKIGSLYRDQGKMVEAESMYQRALEGKEKTLGPEHSSTLSTVNNLGALYFVQGKMVEAESMYQRALKGKEMALGPEHSSTLITVNNLGILYRDQGKMVEAETMYQRALKGRETVLGWEHSYTLETVNNLGNLYRDQGKMVEAETMYQRALKGKEMTLGPEHSSTLITVNNLGSLYRDQGKMVEAETMYRRALEGFENLLGPEHSSTLETVNNLGNFYWKQGKMVEAETMYQRALKGKEMALGPEHSSTLNTVNNLGSLYRDQGKMVEAETMYRRALEGFKEVLGPEHSATLLALHNLEALYRAQGKIEEAEVLLKRYTQVPI